METPDRATHTKVRLALVLLDIPHDYRDVDLEVPHSERRPDFVMVSPYGEVPVLVQGTEVTAQSNAILLKLAAETSRLDGGNIARAAQWLFWEANLLGFALANLRHELGWSKNPDPGVLAWLRMRAESSFSRLAQELEHHSFIMGNELSIADISCAAYAFLSDEAEMDISRWPSVSHWLQRISQVPGWRPMSELMIENQQSQSL